MSTHAKTALCLLIVLVLPKIASAQELTKDEAVGFAAARIDAYQNLAARVDTLSVGGRSTVADLTASNAEVRRQFDTALHSATVVEGPTFDADGIVRVVLQLDTKAIPYATRVRIPKIPAVIRVDGVAGQNGAVREANVIPGDVNDHVKAWIDKKLESSGEAQIDSNRNADEAKADARRIAAANAYTALTRQIDALLLDEDLPVKAYLDTHPQFRPDLSAALILADISSESIDPEGVKYTITLALPALTVARPLRVGKFREWNGTQLTPQEVELARSNARENAKELLRKRIFDTPIRIPGVTIGKQLEKKSPLKDAVERAIHTIPIDRTAITPSGLCKMTVTFDMRTLPDEIRQLLPAQTPDQIEVIGAGLPAKRVEPAAPEAPAAPPEEAPAAPGATTTAPGAAATAPAAAE